MLWRQLGAGKLVQGPLPMVIKWSHPVPLLSVVGEAPVQGVDSSPGGVTGQVLCLLLSAIPIRAGHPGPRQLPPCPGVKAEQVGVGTPGA